jgi:XTP/dITP diphosphohydrolase
LKTLLIATTNAAKLEEYRLLLREFRLNPISLREAQITGEAAEDGATFVENARSKAHFYFTASGLPVLADDGGLEVDALGGAPGVRSHRWLGGGSDDRALAEAIVTKMEGIEPGRRAARIRAAAALIWRENGMVHEAVAEAALEGVIAARCYSEVRPGFPYRSVLWLPERAQYLAELSDEEAAQLSQRRRVVEGLAEALHRVERAAG